MRAPRRPRSGYAGSATARELSVVAAVIASGSEKAAAHQLGLSHSTVKHHLANARFKVGAANTAQLVWILSPRLPDPDDVPASCLVPIVRQPRPPCSSNTVPSRQRRTV